MLSYMGFLVISNYKNQVALHQSYLKTFKLDMEKRNESIGYFFSERKYDLKYLTNSHEISDYFTNKSLGMSESYGLKFSLFLIKKLLEKTISDKLINGRKIYERFIVMDNKGYYLIDTSRTNAENYAKINDHSFFHLKFLSSDHTEPEIFVKRINRKLKIIVAGPCFYKNKAAGELIAILNLSSFSINFINFPHNLSVKGFELITKTGQCLYGNSGGNSCRAYNFILDTRSRTPVKKISSSGLSSVNEYAKLLIAIQPINNSPLELLGWIEKDLVFGTIDPRRLLTATGIIAIIMLTGSGIMIKINLRNMVLKTRFDEAERQQKLLAVKNNQLKNEIARRYKAEQELEKQRTLSIRSDRLRSLGEMAAGIAHELNQPLMGVRGMAELLLLGIKKPGSMSEDKIKKNATIIMEQSDRMVHIIKHVRLFAREAGNIEKTIENLNRVVNSGTSLIQAQLKSHGILLDITLSPDPVFVLINPFSIEEVILNLLGNARDAVEEKQEMCTKIDYTPVISIKTWQHITDKNMACLEIKDNGIGISKNIRSRIFDPFFTTKDPDKGTGLGLSITKAIVEEFSGTIKLNSKKGKGSVFTINFPVWNKEKINQNEKGQCIENINS